MLGDRQSYALLLLCVNCRLWRTVLQYPSTFCICFSLEIPPLKNFSSVQSLSCVRLFATPWTAAHQASLSITNSQSLPKPMSIQLSHPLSFPSPASIFPSIRVFSNESAIHIRLPMYQSFSFNISPSSEHSGLTSFRMDWLDLHEVQGTLKSPFSNTTVQKHQFFGAQLYL